jgi:hypothetical protein
LGVVSITFSEHEVKPLRKMLFVVIESVKRMFLLRAKEVLGAA